MLHVRLPAVAHLEQLQHRGVLRRIQLQPLVAVRQLLLPLRRKAPLVMSMFPSPYH
jgi:hypothetical protein